MKPADALNFPVLLAVLCATAVTARADGQIVEREETYAIAGKSGIELYTSIGQHGPKVGNGASAIAHTNFKLTWQRKYEPQGSACTLVAARPKLIVTYTLPKPSGTLPPETRRRWKTFIDGIRRHEKVHGTMIKAMVKRIEETTIGVSAPADPDCRKVREAIVKPLSEASQAQRQQSRDFDRVEMGKGGTIQRLILDLVK